MIKNTKFSFIFDYFRPQDKPQFLGFIFKRLVMAKSPYILENSISCYKIEEVLSEKIRALIQRSYTAQRDYYDIWYLSNNFPDLNWTVIVDAFYKKMKFKNIEFTGVDQLINPKSKIINIKN